MNKRINVWGRAFDLKIIFDCYDDEEVYDTQNDALKHFVLESDAILNDHSELDKYCINRNGNEIGSAVSNIFKYVIPTTLFIKRDKEKRVVMLLCNYRFDEEHGIALVYENEKLKEIISQDDI